MWIFRNELLCDVKLETDDGTLVCGHKAVLASATPYFQAMFTNFEESKKSHVILRELDSSALKLLVDFIYTGQITVTEHNLQVRLFFIIILFQFFLYVVLICRIPRFCSMPLISYKYKTLKKHVVISYKLNWVQKIVSVLKVWYLCITVRSTCRVSNLMFYKTFCMYYNSIKNLKYWLMVKFIYLFFFL